MNKGKGVSVMKNKNLVTILIVAVVVGAAGFLGGMQYQKSQSPSIEAMMATGNGSGGQRMMIRNGQSGMTGNQGSRPVSGEIISSDDSSVTVKMEDGSTKIIILSDKTTINKSSTGSAEDLKTGEKITAFGSTNSDGSITAQMVSLGATMFRTTMPAGGMNQPKE